MGIASVKHISAPLFALLLAIVFPVAAQQEAIPPKDGASYRTYGQNYKDMIFSFCVGQVYSDVEDARRDAYGTAKHIFEFTSHGQETDDANVESDALIDQYLPLTTNTENIASSLAGCIDLYHSKALDTHMRKFAHTPNKVPGGWLEEKPKKSSSYNKQGFWPLTAGRRYKDTILTACIMAAYKGGGASGVKNDVGNDAAELIGQYLSRIYHDPVFANETGIKVPYDLHKCIDLFHSKPLDDLMRKYVRNPDAMLKD